MSAIRALAEDLASRSDAELRQLMAVRPDVALPPVPDFAALAARASTRVSVQRALEGLNTPQLMVLEAVVLATDLDATTGSTAASLKTSIASTTAKVLEPYLSQLHDVALLRTGPMLKGRRSYFPVETLHDALGPYPAGLGRPLPALADQYPACGLVMTANADVNEQMNAVNEQMGYRLVEQLLEVQKAL